MTPLEYLDWLVENWDLVEDNQLRPDIEEYENKGAIF